jgi:16S rRNA C967 or C1407 C5-methylase (RsmB/RsmF family)
LIYLNFKEYAVIYCAVEIAKIKKYKAIPKFINAILRNALRNKKSLLKIKITSKDVPHWIIKEINFLSEGEKNKLLKTITQKPNLHCVFKKKIHKDFLNLNILKTSSKSIVVNNAYNIESLPGYKNGDWWIQDQTKKVKEWYDFMMATHPFIVQYANKWIISITKKLIL